MHFVDPMYYIIGYIIFSEPVEVVEAPVKPKSFLDAIRKKTFKASSTESLGDQGSDTDEPPTQLLNILGNESLKLSQNIAPVTSQVSLDSNVIALRTLNPDDADEGSIFAATLSITDLKSLQKDQQSLHTHVNQLIKSALDGTASETNLPQEARWMKFLVDNFDDLF
jgi:hypothetical protein